jgi:hypothetical protein
MLRKDICFVSFWFSGSSLRLILVWGLTVESNSFLQNTCKYQRPTRILDVDSFSALQAFKILFGVFCHLFCGKEETHRLTDEAGEIQL